MERKYVYRLPKKLVVFLLTGIGAIFSFMGISHTLNITSLARVVTLPARYSLSENKGGFTGTTSPQCTFIHAWPPDCENGLKHEDNKCERVLKKANFRFPSSLSDSVVDGVRYFVLFVGQGRSGTTITGALIDAHPNVIMSNEYFILHQMASFPSSYTTKRTVMDALNRRQRTVVDHFKKSSHKGYSLYINGSHMGTYEDHVDVIGDKGAGRTVDLYMSDPEKFADVYHKLQHMMNIPVKVIQVLRNPYDTITTDYVYKAGGAELNLKLKNASMVQGDETLDCPIQIFFNRIRWIDRMKDTLKLDLYLVHLSDLIDQPREEMKKLCSFLHIKCSEDYLKLCEGAVFKESSKSRHKVQWTQEQINTVHSLIQQFPYLRRYLFTSD